MVVEHYNGHLLNEQLNSFQMDEEYVLLRTESIATMALFLYVKNPKYHM